MRIGQRRQGGKPRQIVGKAGEQSFVVTPIQAVLVIVGVEIFFACQIGNAQAVCDLAQRWIARQRDAGQYGLAICLDIAGQSFAGAVPCDQFPGKKPLGHSQGPVDGNPGDGVADIDCVVQSAQVPLPLTVVLANGQLVRSAASSAAAGRRLGQRSLHDGCITRWIIDAALARWLRPAEGKSCSDCSSMYGKML